MKEKNRFTDIISLVLKFVLDFIRIVMLRLVTCSLLLLVFGCAKTKTLSQTEKNKDNQVYKLPVQIAPEHARIIGRIVKIYEPNENQKYPCNEYPCLADVSIEALEGTGSTFGPLVRSGDRIKVRFDYSLSPLKEVFPDKKAMDLPGLKVNQSFKADIIGGLSSPPYTIKYYNLYN